MLLSSLAANPARVGKRGAAHEAFTQLFSLAFDPNVVSAYETDVLLAEELEPEPEVSRVPAWAPWTVTALGATAVVTGIAIGVSAHVLAADAEGATGVRRQEIGDSVSDRNLAAGIVGGTGAVLLGAGLYWLWQGEF